MNLAPSMFVTLATSCKNALKSLHNQISKHTKSENWIYELEKECKKHSSSLHGLTKKNVKQF